MTSETWKCKPGSWDTLNVRLFAPPLTVEGFPIILRQSVILPKQLISYKDWRQYSSGDCLHFFLDDYRFEHLWREPARYLSRCEDRTVLSPDFSLYSDYPEQVQRWQVYRSRWLGAYWQAHGATVIPSISWSNERSYKFCFTGVEQGSIVAISTNGCAAAPSAFSAGFDAMMDSLDPELVLCYGNFRHFYRGRRKTQSIITYRPRFEGHRGTAQVHASLNDYPTVQNEVI